jgi:hypothetical protein
MLRMTVGTNQRLSRLNTFGKQNGFRPQMFEVKNTFEICLIQNCIGKLQVTC